MDSKWIGKKYQKIKERAKKRKIPFNLTRKDFFNWWITRQMFCHWCKLPMNPPSVDRLDNTRGYVKDNIVISCMKCNRTRPQARIKRCPKCGHTW